MKHQLLIVSLSKAAWADFCKDWMSWVMLSVVGIALMVAVHASYFLLFDYWYMVSTAACLVGALFTAMLHQNGLDGAYNRPLSMFRITPSIAFASLFFIALSLYSPYPQYVGTLLWMFPEDFQYLLVIDWAIHIFISYLLVRCMFVGMLILEEKLSVLQAFRKSFAMTSNHGFKLVGFFLFLAVILFAGTYSLVGYAIALPYTMLMKALLFKRLQEEAR